MTIHQQQKKPVVAVLLTMTSVIGLAQVRGAEQWREEAMIDSARSISHANVQMHTFAPLPPVTSAKDAINNRGITPNSFLSFQPAVTYDAGGVTTMQVAVADLNGDGKPDIAVANETSSAVSVILGNGDGTFRSAVTYDAGGLYAESVAVADLNGDGKLDLIVAIRCGSGSGDCNGLVGVLLGNGDGTFRPTVTYGSGGQAARSVTVADVNGDDKLDILVAEECPSGGSNCPDMSFGVVGVLLNNGDGTFQTAGTYSAGGGNTASVAVADVNGDSKPDILVANICPSNGTYCVSGSAGVVGVLLGNGDGTFHAVLTYRSGGSATFSVATADVNGDGKQDLLVASSTSSTVGVLLGNADGTFQPPVSYASGGLGALSVAVTDIDGDGKPDLIVANYCAGSTRCLPGVNGAVGVLLGNGDGSFQPALSYDTGGLNARSVAIADVNRDGRLDVVVANGPNFAEGTIGVLLNNTVFGKFTTNTSLTSSLNPSVYGQKVTFTASVTNGGGPLPTGKVAFTSGGIYTIGTATLNSSGVATLSRSLLNAYTFPLTAMYKGDANNHGSTSSIVTQIVRQTTSTATLTSSPNPSTVGQSVTFIARITSPTVMPKGPVTFMVGTTVLGTGQLTGGKATLTISSLAAGSTKVTATYYGDSNIAKSSASVIQTVQ